MAVNGTLIGSFTVLLTGLDLGAVPFPEWQRLAGVMARNLQKRVARSFAAQKTAGNVWLSPNSPKYTASKVAAGLDPRRGHRTGTLQAALNSAKLTMVTLTMQGPGEAAARIIMEEQVLHAMVPHSVYYEETKVNTDGIMSLAASWVREEVVKLRTAELRGKGKAMANAKRAAFSQNVLKAGGLATRRANALNIINSVTNRSGQDILRQGIGARQKNAARMLRRIGR